MKLSFKFYPQLNNLQLSIIEELSFHTTNQGYLVNSDVNGSLNILRKYVKDNVVPMSIFRLRDKGILDMPVRIRVA